MSARLCWVRAVLVDMDFTAWLGETVEVDQKELALPTRVVDALQKAWDEDVLEDEGDGHDAREEGVPGHADHDLGLDVLMIIARPLFALVRPSLEYPRSVMWVV